MAERFEIVEKALLKMLEEKKYSTLRDILITMNPSTPLISTIPSPSLPIPLFYRFLQDFPLYAHTSPSFQSAPLIWCIQSDLSLPVSLFLQKTEFYNEVGC